MFRKKNSIWLVVLFGLISLGLACDAGQSDEANKLVNEANAIFDKNNEIIPKANALTKELLGENWVKAEDNEKYKTDNKAKFDELIKLDETLEKNSGEAAAKWDQISKMKLNDKFKEYAGLKAQEIKKINERDKADNAFIKAFLAEKDAEKANTMIADSDKKGADLQKEITAIKEKSEKIVKDNPTVFK